MKQTSIFYYLLLFLLPVFTGCDKGEDETATAKLIGLSLPGTPNAYTEAFVSNLQNNLKSRDYTLVVTNADGKLANQKKQLDAMLNLGIKAVLLVSPDDNLSENLEPIKAASIPVVSILKSFTDADAVILNDNKGEGEIAAGVVNQYLPSGGKYQILYMTGANPETERTAWTGGLTEQLNASVTQFSNPLSCVNEQAAIDRAKQIVSRDVQVCIAFDDIALQGFVSALDESDKTLDNVKIIVFSGSPKSKQLLKEGKISAIIARSPKTAAASASAVCTGLVNKQTVDPNTLINSILITSENINQYDADIWE